MAAEPDQIERSKIDVTPLRESKLPVIFVIGGPGCGKGTQCERIVATYGFTHLSTGDLLRDEVKSGSKRGQSLQNIMKRGDLVPLDIVLDLLMETMIKALPNSKGFLIDGYPREIDQGTQFEKQIKPCSALLYFEATDATMMERLLKRAQTSGRADDNEETIKKRLQTFHNISKPVVDHYKNKVKTIPADGDEDTIFAKYVVPAMESILFLANSSKMTKPSRSRTHTQDTSNSQVSSSPTATPKSPPDTIVSDSVTSKSNTLEAVEEKSSPSKPSLDEETKDKKETMSESEDENP